jgi:hypothetical protein
MKLPELNEDQKTNARMIADKAREYGIDPELALAVSWAENKFKSEGVSPKNAVGPMQVRLTNAKGLNLKPEDLYDPVINIDAGMRILKENLDAHKGNPRYALIGYNANPTLAKSYALNKNTELPLETQDYLAKIGGMRDLTQTGFISQEAPAQETPVQESNDLSYLGALPEDIDKREPELTGIDQLYQRARELMSGPEGEVDKTLMTGAGALGGAGVGAAQTGVGITKKISKALDAVAKGNAAGLPNVDPKSPGQKWKKTGFGRGEGETVQEFSSAYQRAKGQVNVSGRMSMLLSAAKHSQALQELTRWGTERPG